MDEEHCVIAKPKMNLRDSYQPQINAVTTSFLYVLPPPAGLPRPRRPSLSKGFGGCGNDDAKILNGFELTKKTLPRSISVRYMKLVFVKLDCPTVEGGGGQLVLHVDELEGEEGLCLVKE